MGASIISLLQKKKLRLKKSLNGLFRFIQLDCEKGKIETHVFLAANSGALSTVSLCAWI